MNFALSMMTKGVFKGFIYIYIFVWKSSYSIVLQINYILVFFL